MSVDSVRPETQYAVGDPTHALTQPPMPGLPSQIQPVLALETIRAELAPLVAEAVNEAVGTANITALDGGTF